MQYYIPICINLLLKLCGIIQTYDNIFTSVFDIYTPTLKNEENKLNDDGKSLYVVSVCRRLCRRDRYLLSNYLLEIGISMFNIENAYFYSFANFTLTGILSMLKNYIMIYYDFKLIINIIII